VVGIEIKGEIRKIGNNYYVHILANLGKENKKVKIVI